jgi:hypothetical protein
MAIVKVKKKKLASANLPSQMQQGSMIGANIAGSQPVPSANIMGAQLVPSAMTAGSQPVPSADIMGAQPVPTTDSMSGQIDAIEMRKQGGKPASSTVVQSTQPVKVKKKKSSGMQPSEPLSPQTWANIGNNPSDYPAYLEAFKKQKK